MKTIKRSDLLAQMKREEEERVNAKLFQAMLEGDTLPIVALDLWDTVKALYANVLLVADPDGETRKELYRQLAEFCARLENQGLEAEWESVAEAAGGRGGGRANE